MNKTFKILSLTGIAIAAFAMSACTSDKPVCPVPTTVASQPAVSPSESGPELTLDEGTVMGPQTSTEPLSDEEVPEFKFLKYGETYTYIHGLKITIDKPKNNIAKITIKTGADGWKAETDTNFMVDSQFTIDGQPFNVDMNPNVEAVYYITYSKATADTQTGIQVAGFVIAMWSKNGQPY